MNSKLLPCLALVLSGIFINATTCLGTGTNEVGGYNEGDDRMVMIKVPGVTNRIYFTEQTALFTVQIVVADYPANEKHATPKASDLHVQAWLLRSDGTAIPQSEKPVIIGTQNAGWATDHLIFTFRRQPADKAVGIVVSMNGELHCQELQKDRGKP